MRFTAGRVVLDPDGDLLTNDHVIAPALGGTITVAREYRHDGSPYSATVKVSEGLSAR